ncbi:MAG TPA: carbohydrate ABC transporter permease [Thermomicrobiales bacterium]|nr:carbohydrate ABC transporter permease [Thermomicrobiales bacterium]
MSVVSIEEEIQADAPRVEGRSGTARMVRRRRPLLMALRIAVLLLAAVFFLLPIVWMVLTSFKMPGEYLHRPPIWIPRNPTLNHYRLALDSGGRLAVENSLVIASCATVISLLAGTLAAYSISRFATGGKHLSFWLLSQRMMPPVVVIVPLFLMLRDVGKIDSNFGLDTRFSMIAVYTAFNLPFIVWMMRSYFDGVPLELEESAMVDGCTRLGVFWRIALPLSLPGLIATGTFAFIFSWTEFLFAVVLTRTQATTLPVAIAGYTGTQGSSYGQASALAVVATVPVFVLSLLVQRHFVRGLTLGAVRG